MTTKEKAPDWARPGRINIRISERAHKELAHRANNEGRTILKTLEKLLGLR